ncbi:hypothetical protein LCM10_06130 [Rossellomorea aquimaris]|uniref:hypothetical protein n=1 Tax=Rossellomorea aquimaris TaxID=189382 RepID=UPI001CD46E4E|nr:hypothetical protein [Rossellomorea aquimaris]MCA1054559.1 hypothetical protein [Rossellomorea aquimaris]
MFDPTAFDNLKVVVEGAVYDLDLSGEISIIDRRDLFDFAHYERTYSIEYRLQGKTSSIILELRADMGHFLAEKQGLTEKNEAGAEIVLIYKGDETILRLKEELVHAWGEDKLWEWVESHSSLHPVRVKGILSFNRVITEEMVDDILQMVSYSVETLNRLE